MLNRSRLEPALFVLVLSVVVACGGDSPVARAAQSPTTPTPASGPAASTLVFADELDTAGPLDPSKWGYETGYIRNSEKQYYTTRVENVRAEGGNLVIEARKENYQGFGYTSASINTLGKFEFTYVRVSQQK